MFRDYRVKAKLPGNFTFHVLRHTFGTWLAEKGLAFSEIQVLMGHNDPESTRKYVHAYTPNLVAAIAKLDLPDRTPVVQCAELTTPCEHFHKIDTTSCHSMLSMHKWSDENGEVNR